MQLHEGFPVDSYLLLASLDLWMLELLVGLLTLTQCLKKHPNKIEATSQA